MSNSYIEALEESLKKKILVLHEIMDLCKMQEEILRSDEFNPELFDQLVNDKDICIEKLEILDEGFESVYARVKEVIDADRLVYADDIKYMQNLISEITDISASIMAVEKRNKSGLSNVLVRERKGIAESKRSVNVAMNYYKSMSGLNNLDAQYINKKK